MINNETKEPSVEECSDEEDNEGYFLQATSNSYDIKEKILAANSELFENEHGNNLPRSQKVSFKEDLVDYEPDYSSDDGYVHSPDALTISDDNHEDLDSAHEHDPEALPIVLEELNLSDHEEQEEEIAEEVEDEIVQIIHIDDDADDCQETDAEVSPIKCDDMSLEEHEQGVLKQRDLEIIGCPLKVPRQMEKGPRLFFRQRKCCESQEHRPKLPVYNGLKSEYGLTESQLERRHRRRERRTRKDSERRARAKEEKAQKDVYNEEIFCAWLKSVAERNKSYGKSAAHGPHAKRAAGKPRPRTASEALGCQKPAKCKARRPHTSPSKGYPQNVSLATPGIIMAELIIIPK